MSGIFQTGEYTGVTLETPRGRIDCMHYQANGADAGIICVGGVGGGWDTPAHDLYPALAKALQREGISGLRLKFRNPRELKEAVPDVIDGIAFLERTGVRRIGLVGHSFGGAVVIGAAALNGSVKTVVTLATQSGGATEVIPRLGPDCSILLIHGDRDMVLPDDCSRSLYQIVRNRKELLILKGDDHNLTHSADEVKSVVRQWLLHELKDPLINTMPGV